MTGRKTAQTQSYPATAGGLRIHLAIAHDLGVAIVTGQHKPGDTLSGEVAFSQQHKVSRSAYREAVRMLAAKGLVSSRPKTGTRVNPFKRWNLLDPEVLGWMFEAEPPRSFIRDLFELRQIIEPAAAEYAAQRRTGADLARMGHALEEMARHGLNTAEGRAADQAFHDAILQAAGNAPLTALGGTISAAVSWTTIFKQRKGRLARDPLPDHRQVYDAIANADPPAARRAMADLVQMALQDTEGFVES